MKRLGWFCFGLSAILGLSNLANVNMAALWLSGAFGGFAIYAMLDYWRFVGHRQEQVVHAARVILYKAAIEDDGEPQ